MIKRVMVIIVLVNKLKARIILKTQANYNNKRHTEMVLFTVKPRQVRALHPPQGLDVNYFLKLNRRGLSESLHFF